ncbi:hypothetical protein EST38_g4871 [Candolleomyces aberdarensis]|uniref:Adenylyl cyclase-associated protein n=1 Tax=Candolleomyces aberdarensis TaxID=2316362 RepID=A0A4Q2DLW0_9AGAR|nr:hypothetical protein EST38_g4871 [Candolleomyces aberdarensis]
MANPAQGLHSLATIIKRLEAATSRIEDIVSTQGSLAPQGAVPGPKQSPGESSVPPPPPPPPPPPAPAALTQETPATVIAFDEQIIEGKIKPFVKVSNELGSASVTELAGLIEKEYTVLRSFLLAAATCQKPDQKALEALLGGLVTSIEAVSKAKELLRSDNSWLSHLNLIAEGAPAVGWVVTPKPGPYVEGIKESVDYYVNKVIKEFKEKGPKHAEWARSYGGILTELQKYAKEHYTTGLVWNAKGIPYDQFKSSSAGGAPGAPPPPPPPPPKAAAAPASGGGATAVFAEINKGADITKGLRKVDKSEMTHKNPSLRAGNTVPASTSTSPAGKKPIKPTKPSALAGKKPPKFALEGNKWLIEHQENESSLTVENGEISQSVNIFGCKNAVIIIKGKINAVTIYNSVKTAVLVDSVVSSISVTSSPSFTVQVQGTAPMIQIDSTDSGQVYLSKDSLNTEITTAKCSAINISIPDGDEEGVFQEQPVPEMLKSVVQNGKLVTTVVEHTG